MIKRIMTFSLFLFLIMAAAIKPAFSEVKITGVSVSPRILLDIYTAVEKGQGVQLVNPNIFILSALSNETADNLHFRVEIRDGKQWVARADFYTKKPLQEGSNVYNAGEIDASQSNPQFNQDYKPDFDISKAVSGAVIPMGNYSIAFVPVSPPGPEYSVTLALFTPTSSLARPAFPVYPRNVAVNTLLPVFNWMPAKDAKSYEVIVGPNIEPEANTYWKSGKISGTQVVYDSKARALKPDTKYYWKIISYNAFGQPVGGNNGRSQAAWFKVNNYQKTGSTVTPEEADRIIRRVIKDQKILKVLRDYKAVGLETDCKDLAALLKQLQNGSAKIIDKQLK